MADQLNVWFIAFDTNHSRLSQPRLVKVPHDANVATLAGSISSNFPELGSSLYMEIWKTNTGGRRRPIYCTSLKENLDKPSGARIVTEFAEGIAAARLIRKDVSNKLMAHLLVLYKSDDSNRSDEGASDDVAEDVTERFKRSLNKILSASVPSVASETAEYRKYQSSKGAILDGRYNGDLCIDTGGPPIEIFHPVFCQFLRDVNGSDDMPASIFLATVTLMSHRAAVADEQNPRDPQKLLDALHIALNLNIYLDHTSSAMIATHQLANVKGSAALLIGQDLAEIGASGSDPSIQATMSYGKFWVGQEHKRVRSATCCPSLLLAFTGPWMCVMGAVFTSEPIVQRLSPMLWLGISPILNHGQVMQIARVLYALRNALVYLRSYYDSLEIPNILPMTSTNPRFFPWICNYPGPWGRPRDFVYLQPLQNDAACSIFLAQDVLSHEHIVVKFASTYGVDAHQLLAGKGMAPVVYSCQPLEHTELTIVVMEYIVGETLVSFCGSNPVSADIRAKVLEAISILHEGGMVFGDLRKPNIMRRSDGSIKLIDFELAGREDAVRYPPSLSTAIQWPKGVGPGQKVMKEHDIDLWRLL